MTRERQPSPENHPAIVPDGSVERDPRERFERVRQQITELVMRVQGDRVQARERQAAEIDRLRGEAEGDLSPEEIDAAEKEIGLAERAQQLEQQRAWLTQETLDGIRDAIALLGEGFTDEEKEQLLEAVPMDRAGFGTFYDTYSLGDADVVVKELKLNYLFSGEQATKMLARHEIEAERMRDYYGDMVPETRFVIAPEREEAFAKEKERLLKSGAKLYDWATFTKIQVDRRLQSRYARRDVAGEERRGMDKLFGKAGELLRSRGAFRQESAGVMVSEKVQGISFGEFFRRYSPETTPRYAELRESVRKFVDSTRKFQEKFALMWHRFDSDNVVVEVGDDGEPTGRVRVIDLNFTEKSSELLRRKLVKGIDRTKLQPLEEWFSLDQDVLPTVEVE